MLTHLSYNVLKVLADGKFHSGESLGLKFDCTRTRIWQIIECIESEFNVQIFRVKGKGYRLAKPLYLLDAQRIEHLLQSDSVKWQVEVLESIDSTNTQLMARANKLNLAEAKLLVAERQTNGRGRLGRAWQSSLGASLTFSVRWPFERSMAQLSGLSLLVGLAVAEALNEYDAQIRLKWPNDIYLNEKKLGGILIELAGDPLSSATVVIGIGLNIQKPVEQIDQAVASLDELSIDLDRNKILGNILLHLSRALMLFDQQGFSPFIDRWLSLCIHQHKMVTLSSFNTKTEGICRGIDKSGALLIETSQGIETIHVGDVSLRPLR